VGEGRRVEEVAADWNEASSAARAARREPAVVPEGEDLRLQEEVGSAMRAGDLQAALRAAARWRETWMKAIRENKAAARWPDLDPRGAPGVEEMFRRGGRWGRSGGER
jgi:hypothetical protein